MKYLVRNFFKGLALLGVAAIPSAQADKNPAALTVPVPAAPIYPTQPYVTPEMYGAVGNGATDDHLAVNAATAAACRSNRSLILFLDKYYYMGHTTWNATSGVGCNSGLTVIGNGNDSSGILYKAANNNTGVEWDLTGARFITASNFVVGGGTPAGNNSPKVVVLMGAANSGGFLFSGVMSFYDVSIGSFQGTTVVEDDGAEQIHFLNCNLTQASTGGTEGMVFTASGSTPPTTSALVTTYSPVQSMTDVHWEGAKATFQFSGAFGVLFNFTPTSYGGVGRIYVDDYIRIDTPRGHSIFMSDNSADGLNQSVSQVGGHRLALENDGGDGGLIVGHFGASIWQDIHFDGDTVSTTSLTNPSFETSNGMTLENASIQWNPNAGGKFSGGYVLAPGNNAAVDGVIVQAPVPKANILSGGGTNNSFILQGTNGTIVR